MIRNTSATQEVGQRLRFLRRTADLTQHQLGKQIGRQASFISSIERGQLAPRRVDVLKIAEALSVDPAELIADLKGAAR